MRNDIEVTIKLTEELITALIRGKRINYLEGNLRITILPPNFGMTLFPDEYNQLKQYVFAANNYIYSKEGMDLIKKIEERNYGYKDEP